MPGTQVGSLYYDLSVDDKNLNKQLQNAEGSVKDFAGKLHDGLNKAAAGFAVAGAGLSLISKNATDFTVDFVKSSKSMAREIGTSTEEASRLTAAFTRMGLEGDKTQQMFGLLAKKITAATDDTAKNKTANEALQIQLKKTQAELDGSTASLKQQQLTLQNQMDATKIAIKTATDQIASHGDASGALANRVQALKLKLADLKSQYDDTNNSTGAAALKTTELKNKLDDLHNQMNANTSAFDKLGISVLDENGKQKDFNTILFEVADKFKSMPNGIDKTSLALDLFGRSGKDMIKVLNLGSQGIQDLEKQADKLGLTLTPTTIGRVEAYISSQKDLKESTDALKIAVGTATTPVLTEFQKKLNDVEMGLLANDGPLKSATIAVLAFGGPVLMAASGLLAFGANVAQIASVWPAFLGPVGLVIIGVLATAAAVYLLVTHLQTVRDFFKTDWGIAIQAAITVMFPFIGLPMLIILHWQGLLEFLKGMWHWVQDNWPYLAGALLGPFGLAAAFIYMHLNSIKNAITNTFNNAYNLLYNTGQWIVWGLKDGILSVINSIRDAAGNIANTVKDKVKNVLGIKSPSKIFQDIGANVSLGFAKGIDQTAHLANMAVNRLSSNIISPNLNISASGDGGGGGNTTHRYGDTIVQIGSVNNQQDEDYVMRRLDRNSQLVSQGISPVGGL